MSGTTPRRRHSPAVYRRRRIVLVILIVGIGIAIWLMIAQPWRGSATETDQRATPVKTQDAATELPVPATAETPGATDTATDAVADETASSPSPSATPGAAACIAHDVTVEPVTDQPTYASGQNPQLSIKLTNTGSTDCTLNVGTSSQVFTITSGSDVWWRSTDCQTEPSDMVVLLAAGQSVSSAAPLTWDRTRSAVGSCADPDRPRAPGGGASYHLSVEIGGIPSAQTAPILLY